MSIVEKAVNRHAPRNRRSTDAVEPETKVAGGQVAWPETHADGSPKVIVDTKASAQAGLGSMADDPLLERDFKFLKRPLLSRVFGLSGANAKEGHMVLITSDMPGAGKSFVSFNLAASIAREQLTRVMLIDADPLQRNLTTALQQEDQPGLLEVLADPESHLDSVALPTDIPTLNFIPAGQPDPNCSELLASRRLMEVLNELDDPDTVFLLDSPPLLLTAEGRVLAERVDHTLVVVESGRTSAADVAAVLKMLDTAESSISLILNKAPWSNSGHEAGYYGYGY